MAITYVGSDGLVSRNITDSTPGALDLPSGLQDDDLIVILVAKDQWDRDIIISGYTEFQPPGSEFQFGNSAIFYKFASGEGLSQNVLTDSASSTRIALASAAFRGVDQTNPFDVAYSSAQALNTTDVGSFSHPDITTVTDGAWVILHYLQLAFTGAGLPGAVGTPDATPSGYTHVTPNGTSQSGDPINSFAYQEIASAGSVDPGVWGDSPNDNTKILTTFALRPAGAAAGGRTNVLRGPFALNSPLG